MKEGTMDAKQLAEQLNEFDKRRAAQSHKILVQMAQQIAKADTLTDEEMRTLDAQLKTAGVTRQQLCEMIRTLNGYKKRTIVTPREEAELASNLTAAKLHLKEVMTERELLPQIGKTRHEQEARERWFQRRDDATAAVREAEAAIKRLAMTKTGMAAIEKRYAELVGMGAK
jgi:hypothetical protein